MSLRPWLLAALTYLVGTLVFTLPMPLHMGTHVWGDRFDAWTTMWLIWTLGEHGWSETTQLIFYPEGYSLWSFGHVALQLLGAPFVAMGASVVTVYNGLLIASFSLTGLAGHALGRRLSGSHWGGLLCGALLAWNPYTYGEMSAGCVELVGAFFLPLYLLCLVRLCDAPTLRNAGFAALTLACIGPFNWYYTAFMGMFTVAFMAWRAFVPVPGRWRVVALIGGAAFVAALSSVPLVLKARQETPERGLLSADTFSEENWSRSNAITDGGVALQDLDEELLRTHDTLQVAINSTSLISLSKAGFPTNPLESTPGRLAYAVGLFGLVAAGRRGRGWALIAGAFTVLTLGPFLQLDATPPLSQWSLSDPLPYYGLYNEVPFFAKAYRPYRLGVVVLLCLGALGASGFAALRGPRRWLPVAFALAAATQPHWAGASTGRELADARVPGVYEDLAASPEGAVIELPLHYQPVTPANARFQFNQVVHGKPLLNCNQLIRRTDLMRFRAVVVGNTLLSTLLDLGRADPPYAFTQEDAQALLHQGFAWLVAHDEVPEDQAALAGFVAEADRLKQPAWEMLEEAFGAPVLNRDGARVYALQARGGRWEGGWEDRSLAWADLGLTITLLPGSEGLELGPAGEYSFWVLRPEDDPGAGQLLLGEVPIDTVTGSWVRRQASSERALLRALGGPVRLQLSGLQRRLP